MVRKLTLVMLCVILILVATTIHTAATTNMGYYDQEDEPNDTTGTADAITSERLIRGAFPSTSDNYDYYSTYIVSGSSVYIQLSTVQGGCDYDLALLNPGGSQVAASANFDNIGEWIDHTASSAGTHCIRVRRFSGSNITPYRLYTQTSGRKFNHSYYVTNINSDDYMYRLGRDETNNVSGLVIVDVGRPAKRNGQYGVTDLSNNWANMARVKAAIDKFIEGYNANPRHTNNIGVVVGTSNRLSPTDPLPGTTSEYSAHGAAFKQMVTSIATSGRVTVINAAIDAEMRWNTPSLTLEWVRGFSEASGWRRLYNFGDHAGRWDDFSGEPNPVFDNGWTAENIWQISWGNACSYCIPLIYSNANADQWTYQKKWAYNHGKSQLYDGLVSTNGWDDYLKNQQSYTAFYNKLQAEGLGETLENCTWMALSSQP